MEKESAELQEAFRILRPLCVTLTTDHTKENVASLQQCCENINGKVLQNLQEYVLFPLRLILKQPKHKKDGIYEKVIDCLNLVLGKTKVISVSVFHDIFNTLCILITINSDIMLVSPVSEELKISVVKCLSTLLKSTSSQVLDEMYNPAFLPAVGHAVTLLLTLTEREENRELRELSINCLMEMALVNGKVTEKQKEMSSRCFASFLPGISMALCKVITGDTKIGYRIITAAIKAWQKIVTLVLNDKVIGKPENYYEKCEKKLDVKYTSLLVVKNEKWVQSTAEKLHVLTLKIKELKNNSNWRVRMSMVEWAGDLLNNCARSLESCIPDFLEVLVSLVNDDFVNVSKKSQEMLAAYQKSDNLHGRVLKDILEENLHTMATQLPRLIRTADEDSKLSTVRLFNGYLELLGSNINSMLNSSAHLQRVSLALVQVLELDCSSISLIQEKNQGDSFLSFYHQDQMYSLPKKNFKHFNNESIYSHLINTCKMLGRHGDVDILYDHFLEMFHQNKLYRKQAILILNHISQGMLERETFMQESSSQNRMPESDTRKAIRSLLNVCLDAEHLNLKTRCHESDVRYPVINPVLDTTIIPSRTGVSNSFLQVNSNIMQTCLLLESINTYIKILGKDYEYLMMDVLYPVLEKIGHENTAISRTAYLTLANIAVCYEYRSTEELLKANANYLVNAVSLRMRHLNENPETPKVLGVILHHADKDILPLVEDTVNEVLEALDNYYEDSGFLLMNVLLTMTIVIRKWFSNEEIEQKSKLEKEVENVQSSCSHSTTCNTSECVKNYVLDYLKQKKIAESDFINCSSEDTSSEKEGGEEDTSEGVDDDDDKVKEIPYEIKKIKQIMQRCAHLLSCKDTKVRLLTLDTISQGLYALQPQENELLPMVHLLWAPFIQRLKDKEIVVILKACAVLHTFAAVSKDFIRQRVVKDVFPKMVEFLEKQSSFSLKAGPVYHHGMACKLQSAILKDIGKLCRLVGVGDKYLTSLIHACIPYLSARQPQILQQACLKTLREFSALEPDTVWIILHQVYSPGPFVPPQANFLNIKFEHAGGHCKTNDCLDNVLEILKYLDR